MKILLISDTHGNIDEIPIKSILSCAQICIHTGDFGFYDTNSVKALTQKEIQLQIKHSKLPDAEKEKLLKEKENILAGISSGAALKGAIEIAKKEENKNIVVLFADSGDKYFSTGVFD